MDYKEILEEYSYSDDEIILDRIKNTDGTNEQENQDILNMIVLWKLNRMVEVPDALLSRIRVLELDELFSESVICELKEIVIKLLSCKGIRLPMASTILKMFHPDELPIIDQRAYRIIYGKEIPTFYSKRASREYADLYVYYIKQCHKFWKEECCCEIPFKDVDKVLYQMDIDKGNHVKY